MNTSPVLLLLIVLLSACHGEEQIHSNASSISATMKAQKVEMSIEGSCPDPADIEPCVCTNDINLDMDCTDIQDEQQLWQVFSAHFPSTAFDQLTIWNNLQDLKVLESGVFHDVSFRTIDIEMGNLEVVEDEALTPSLSTLTNIYIKKCHLTTFPLERLAEFTSLQWLFLDGNYLLSIPPLSSSTLQFLDLTYNPISSLPPDVFKGLPAIDHINLYGCGLTEITPGTFKDLPELYGLDLRKNRLRYLQSLTFDMVSSPRYTGRIKLDYNDIDFVEVDAFKGVQEFSVITMDENALTRLPERTWRPVLEKGINVTFTDNPLTCGCDVAWLVRNPQMLTAAQEAQCTDGNYLTDLDPADFSMCG